MALVSTSIDQQVKVDFQEIWETYGHERLAIPAKQRDILRASHKYAVCLSMLATAIKTRPENERVFLQEAASDAIHLIHVLMMGDSRGACFYLRSIIENFWRQNYFNTHPVEYEWLTSRGKYHVTMKDLREYCGWLNQFGGELKVSLNSLDRLYAELSIDVHSTSARTLVLRETLNQITLSEADGKKVAPRVRDVLKDVIVLTIFSSRDVFDGLHVNGQAFILSCLDSARKKRRQTDLSGE